VSAHQTLLGHEPIAGEPLMSVTHGQCDARPTLPSQHQGITNQVAGTKLYCLVTEAQCVLTVCPGLHSTAGWQDSNPQPADRKSSNLTNQPPSNIMQLVVVTKLNLQYLNLIFTSKFNVGDSLLKDSDLCGCC